MAGAVYRPLAIVPIGGERVQVTAVLLDPVTVAVSCCVWEAVKLVLAGPRVIETGGVKLIDAVAVLVGSATLVAVTVTF